jgi:hypothetical protein
VRRSRQFDRREPTPVYTNRLECEQCGRVSPEGERGWTAHLTAEDDGSDGVAVFCSECDEREFGRAVDGPLLDGIGETADLPVRLPVDLSEPAGSTWLQRLGGG